MDLVRRAIRWAVSHRLGIEIEVDTVHHGSEYGGWTICPTPLGSESIVYSLGVGEDVTFDLAVIEEYGVRVFAFDPTPKAVAWVRSRDLPDAFEFHPWGVAGFDGEAEFLPPPEADHASYRIGSDHNRHGLELPVRRLGTIMAELGHHRIDLLKMDIEGAEYMVVRDLVGQQLEVDQLVVEVHDRSSRILGRNWQLFRSLRRAGSRLFAMSDSGRELSLLHTRLGHDAARR